MSKLSPTQILTQVAAATPPECRHNIIIIGSLAAGYHFFHNDAARVVHTKDIDCILEPYHAAVGAGQEIAQALLQAGWKRRDQGDWGKAADANTPENQLPAIRLYPPGSDTESEDAWFIELLTVPKSENDTGREWTRIELEIGHFGLPSFRFLGLSAFESLHAGTLGIRYARPVMMALANLLEHPVIKPERMSALFAGRSIKRSNKDLGRVLAIATLSPEGEYVEWTDRWLRAMKQNFPTQWRDHVRHTGDGLRALLGSPEDLDEASHTCNFGLLASRPTTSERLRFAGERLLMDAIEPMEGSADL